MDIQIRLTCTTNSHSSRYVSDPNCRLNFINVLATFPSCSRKAELQVFFWYFYVQRVLRKKRHDLNTRETSLQKGIKIANRIGAQKQRCENHGSGYLAKTFGVEGGLSDNTVGSFLTRDVTIDISALHFDSSWFDTSLFSHRLLHHLRLEPLFFPPPYIHPEKHVSPVLHWKLSKEFKESLKVPYGCYDSLSYDYLSRIKLYSLCPKEDDPFLGRHGNLCNFILCVKWRVK